MEKEGVCTFFLLIIEQCIWQAWKSENWLKKNFNDEAIHPSKGENKQAKKQLRY